MTRLIVVGCLVSLCFGDAPVAEAQVPEPEIRLIHVGADRLISDMQAVMSLTTPEEQQETKTIKDYLEVSFVGMSLNRLMRMDVLCGEGAIRYRPAFPLKDEETFWTKNLNPNGIQKNRRYSNTLCSTKGAFIGYLRIRDNYAIFGEKKEDVALKGLAPDKEVAKLAKLTENAAMELVNKLEGVDERHKSFNGELGVRQDMMKQIVKSKSESQDMFDLRKLASEHQLDELERIYAEAKNCRLLANFDPEDMTTELKLDLEPIPATQLAQSIQLLNLAPLSFANIPKAPKSNMSLRVRFPLDAMRQRHLTETFKMLQNMSHKEAEENTKKTEQQKEVTAEVIDLTFKLLLANVDRGMADGFFEAHPNPNDTNTAIAGFKAADGNAPLAILKLLEQTRDGQKVEMEIAEQDGVKLHSFLTSEDQHPGFGKFFGGYKVYVGTSADAIWMGAGPQALEELKTAIHQAAQPNQSKASDPFLTASGRAVPWIEFHSMNYPDSGSQMFQDLRKMMIEAGKKGDDHFQMWLNRKGTDVTGELTAEPGFSRFIGKYLADFSKKNL